MFVITFLLSFLVSLIVVLCYVLVFSFTLWMAIDAGKQDRFWWLTFIIAVPVIGSGSYYFTEKKHEYARAPVHHIHTSETEEQHEVAPKKRRTLRKLKKIEKQEEIQNTSSEDTTLKSEEEIKEV